MAHRRARAAWLALSALLLVAACGDDDDTATSTSAEVDETTTTASAGDGATTDSSAEDPAGGTADEGIIDITVAGGQVTGGGRHEIPLGEAVVLRVTSDAADEVHLHGYDLTVDVVPGEPAELRFDANIPGVFEAELHDSGIVLAELQIQ